MSVHVIGRTYTDFLRTQVDLALELDKRLVFWITLEAETSTDPKVTRLIEDIRQGAIQKDCEWLNSRSAQAFAEYLLKRLKPRPRCR